MTCIVGWIEENKKKGIRDVFLGGDSAGVAGLRVRIRADEKVFRNGDMIFGYTSSFRMGQLLRYSLSVPEQSPKKDDYEFMCTDFIDTVARTLEKNKCATINNNEMSIGTFLVGYKGNLYSVEDDLQVAKPMFNYESVGCGIDIAMGAMYAVRDIKMTPRKRITKALEAAVEFSGGVRPPFVIIKL